MIGGGQLAYGLLGVDFNDSTGHAEFVSFLGMDARLLSIHDVKFLVFDPQGK